MQESSSQNIDSSHREPAEMDAGELIHHVVTTSVGRSASDLFFSPHDGFCDISMRRMGIVEGLLRVPRPLGQQMINTIKSQAGMDLNEKKRPTDGRWSYQLERSSIDFRVNSMGTFHGEDLSLRIMRPEERLHDLGGLGLLEPQASLLKSMLVRPSGLLLVTGPTGSGKSTTLYACLNYLNDGRRRIHTLEDPVEHLIEGIRQSQVSANFGLDFLELLRGAMRQSPDVIMVGEVRDAETAATAVRAANSGHLVLATLHAGLATSAVHSMLAFGVHPYFLSNALVGVIAQRLVRTLNPEHRVEYPLPANAETFEEVSHLLNEGEGRAIYGPSSEIRDVNQAYLGQTGLFEILPVQGVIRDTINRQRPGSEVREAAIKHGMLDFRKSGLIKVARGTTSLEEMLRQVPVEEDHPNPESQESSSQTPDPSPSTEPKVKCVSTGIAKANSLVGQCSLLGSHQPRVSAR